MLNIKAAIFDLDDTLYPEAQYVKSGYRFVSDFLNKRNAANQDFSGWLWQRFVGGKSAGAFDELNANFKLGLNDGDIKKLVEVYRLHKPSVKPREGFVELLEKLRDSRIKTGVISDGFMPAQQYKLDALNIEDLFDEVIFTESLGAARDFWKPSTKAFELMAENLNVPHQQCCYIADNLSKDFIGPNRLGWVCILFRAEDQIHTSPNENPGAQPQYTVNSIAQLRKLLLSSAT